MGAGRRGPWKRPASGHGTFWRVSQELIEAPPQSAQDPHNLGLDPFECPQFAGGEKELTMSLTRFIDDACPRVRNPGKLTLIEPHPSDRDLAIHNYHCVDCGPVRARSSLEGRLNGQQPVKKSLRAAFDPKIFLAKLGDGKTISKYQKEQIVFSQGDVADAVFYIQRGKIKLTVVSERGKEAVVGVWDPLTFAAKDVSMAIRCGSYSYGDRAIPDYAHSQSGNDCYFA